MPADDGAVEIWNLARGERVHRIVADDYQSVAARPDTGWLVTYKQRKPVVRVWTVPDRGTVSHATTAAGEDTAWVRAAPGGAWLASPSLNGGHRMVAVRMTDARSGATLRVVDT